MSHLYDTIEPNVIEDGMLNAAVIEQGPKDEAGKVAKQEGIEFKDVKSLQLDYKNIIKIENIAEFVNLTKLQLDNNIIEKIEGIDMLVNLVWLDLSFNNIEVIEGMSKLTKLEDLTLYNNRISTIANMDKLLNLQVFSIGNNDLAKLENLQYLRRFPKLKALNLSNNPICQLDAYKLYVGAFLPGLVYLDYRLITDDMRTQGYEKYSIQVELLLEADRKHRAAREIEDENAKEYATHCKAFVNGLNGPRLFDDMYLDDPEGCTLNELTGAQELVAVFKEKFTAVCIKMFHFGLQEYKKREAEVKLFWECLEEAKADTKKQSQKAIEEFMKLRVTVFDELRQLTDLKQIHRLAHEYNASVTQLWDQLMGFEIVLMDQLDDTAQLFSLQLQDHVSFFQEHMAANTAILREAQLSHHEKILNLATDSLDLVMTKDWDSISDDLRNMFVDKDTVVAAVASSNDVHLLKIDNKEDRMMSGINSWMNNLMEKIHQEEIVRRNRHRVIEINRFVDHMRDDLDNVELNTGTR